MALELPPYCLQAATVKHGAQLFRDAISTLISPTGGVVSSGDYQITEHVAANMSVNVAAGQAWVPGTSATAQGLYYIRNGAPVNLGIGASDPSNPRAETIILRIKDSAYAGAEDTAELAVIAGTAEAGVKLEGGGKPPKGAGAVPVSSLVLAYVLVPAAASSITAADIENTVRQSTVRSVAYEQNWSTPKAFSTGEAEAGKEISAARAAFVVFRTGIGGLSIGGVALKGGAENQGPWLVPAGQKWKGNTSGEYQTVLL